MSVPFSSKKQKAARKARVRKPAAAEDILRLPRSYFGHDWLWVLVLSGAILLAYSPLFFAGFIWDDDNHITSNPCIVGPLGLKEIWTTNAARFFPLTLTIFWLEHAIWGLEPLPYHFVNVIQHGTCAILLWRVLRSLKVPGAWMGATLWALHPVQVESVAWVAEMKNTLSAIFYLLTVLFFIRWLTAGKPSERRADDWNYVLTLIFAAFAMLSKSSTVILPVVLFLAACWVEGRLHWRHLTYLIPIFLMSAAACVLAIWAVNLEGTEGPQKALSLQERAVVVGDASWFYLGKLLWPYPLMTVYPLWKPNAQSFFSYIPIVTTAIMLLVFWLYRRSWAKSFFFVAIYFLAALLPVIGFVNMGYFRYSFVADHLQYLASMGPMALLGAGLAKNIDSVTYKKHWLQIGFVAGLILILGILTWNRTWAYENEETLWTDELAKNSSCWIANGNLGEALIQRGQIDEGTAQLRKALSNNPDFVIAHNNLATVLLRENQVNEAIAEYQKALDLNPNAPDSLYGLGTAFFLKGQVGKAIEEYQKSLNINPYNADVHNNLGIAFAKEGKMEEACMQFRVALQLQPGRSDVQNNLERAEAFSAPKSNSK